MAVFKQTITNTGTIGGQRRQWSQTISKRANQVIDQEITVGSTDQPIELLTITTAAATTANTFDDFSGLTIYNPGETTAEIMLQTLNYYDNSGVDAFVATSGNADKWSWISWLLRPTEFITLPNPRAIGYHTPTSSDIPSSAALASSQSSDSLKTAGSGNTYVTSSTGYFKTTDYFGMTDTAGIVPGSFWVNFYTRGYQELGMNSAAQGKGNQTSASSTGLSTNTAYEFRITVDGGTIRQVSFTTDGSNVNWGGSNGVLRKINAALEALFVAGDITSRARASIVNGDIRFFSGSRKSTSAIALAAGATGTAEFFGTGNIPAVGDCEGAVASALETASLLNLDPASTAFYLIDRGNGLGRRSLGGSCKINYDEGGTVELFNCPPNAHFSAGFINNSAHSGEVSYHADTSNIIYKVWGRSVSPKKNAQLRINGFN